MGPSKYIVVDAPLGRVHTESGKYFDFMVFVDTPLDVAMARRLSRDLALESADNETETIANLMAEAEAYPHKIRPIFTSHAERIKPTCDLVLDGTLSLDELASAIISRLP